MKKIFFLTLLIIGIMNAASFTVDDPPMFYVFNFVTYNGITVIDSAPKKNKLLEIPLVNEKILNTNNNKLMLKEELNPKLLSAMITTAISEYSQVKIAGESMQKRLESDNIMDILKSYEYGNETDFVFIGEINTLAQNLEIDLKIIDVSRQIIVNGKSFQIPITEITRLRAEITNYVKLIMDEFLIPFTGVVSLHTDSIGMEEIQQDMIVIRSVSSKVGSITSLNTDKNFKRFKLKKLGLKSEHNFGEYLNEFPDGRYSIISADEINNYQFLEGDYIARIYLKDNKGFYETAFTVRPGIINEIIYLPKREIIPEIEIHQNGILNISGIKDNMLINVFILANPSDKYSVCVLNDGESLYENPNISVNWNENENTYKINKLPFGSYEIITFNLSNEIFPGKASVNYLRFKESLELSEKNYERTVNIRNNSTEGNRDVIIYFNPFPESFDESYTVYSSEFDLPLTIVENAGELRINNISDSLQGNLIVFREGYQEAILSLRQDTKKQYYYVDLSIPEEGYEAIKSDGDHETDFYQKVSEPEAQTYEFDTPQHTEETPFVTDEEPLIFEEQIQQTDTYTAENSLLETTPKSVVKVDKDFSSTFQSLRAFLSIGVAQPGLMGTTAGSYTHNPVKTGFNIEIGARNSLSDFIELPEYLPLTAQVGLGFQMNKAIGFFTEDLMAITLNIDVLYNIDEIDDIPLIDFNPYLGINFDAQIYETFSAYLLGLQLGVMVSSDLSDLVVKGLDVELIIAQNFDFDVSGKVNPFLATTYMNLGVSYAFEF